MAAALLRGDAGAPDVGGDRGRGGPSRAEGRHALPAGKPGAGLRAPVCCGQGPSLPAGGLRDPGPRPAGPDTRPGAQGLRAQGGRGKDLEIDRAGARVLHRKPRAGGAGDGAALRVRRRPAVASQPISPARPGKLDGRCRPAGWACGGFMSATMKSAIKLYRRAVPESARIQLETGTTPKRETSAVAGKGDDGTAPDMVHAAHGAAGQGHRRPVLPFGERSRARTGMAARVICGRPKVDRQRPDESGVRVALRAAPVPAAERPRRIVRGAKQADRREERQSDLHRVGGGHAAPARFHQEEPGDARQGAEAGGSAKEGS